MLSKDVVLDFTGREDVLLLTGRGRYIPPKIEVEIEEEVYRFVPADNGAGPMWSRGSTSLVRCGELVFAAGLETLPDVKPLNNCVPLLFYRHDDGWKLIYRGDEDKDRTREPSPVVCFDDGGLFLSVNPTLTPRDTYNGPSEPAFWSSIPRPRSGLPNPSARLGRFAAIHRTLLPQFCR